MSGSVQEKRHTSEFLGGYAAFGSEHTEAGFGTGELGEGDLCEKYTIGVTPSAQDRRDAPQYYSDPEAQRYFRENIFPDDDFHRAWEVYFESLSETAEIVLGAVRQALNLPDSEWSADTNRPASILRFLDYPETRSSAVFFYTPNWDCGLRLVSPRGVDSELGQMAEDFGLDELRDPDGLISYCRLQNRAVDRGFTS